MLEESLAACSDYIHLCQIFHLCSLKNPFLCEVYNVSALLNSGVAM